MMKAPVRCLQCGHVWDGDKQWSDRKETKCPKCGNKKREALWVAVYPDGREIIVDLTKPVGCQGIH